MKTIKKLSAIIFFFAAILCFATICASALEKGDTIEWSYDDIEDEAFYFEYGGKLTEGKNSIKEPEKAILYEFDVKKSGVYLVSLDENTEPYIEVYICFAEKYENSKAFNRLDGYITTEGTLYYFNEETQLLHIDANCEQLSFDIEYLGDVNDITLSEYLSGDILIEGMDLFLLEDENEYHYYSNYGFIAEFTGGRIIDTHTDFAYSDFKCIDKPVNGANRVEFEFMGFKKEVTLNVYDITYFIESIEIENLEKYTETYEYYDGSFEYTSFAEFPPNIKLNFSDGTSKSLKYSIDNFYTLPNGKDFNIYITLYDDVINGKRSFAVWGYGHKYIEGKSPVHKANPQKNYALFSKKHMNILNSYSFYISYCIERIYSSDSFVDLADDLKDLLSTVYIKKILNEIYMFTKFILTY